VRVIELSNHPAKLRQSAQDKRAAAAAQAQSEYDALLAAHAAQLDAMRVEREEARSRHRWLRVLSSNVVIWLAAQERPRRPRVQHVVSNDESRIAAGIEGEQLVVDQLATELGDEWVLFRGYKNRRGEIDHLLLGPQGLIAIEGKHHSKTVSCRGDEWWYDRYDRAGIHRERDWLTDGRGRSPSRQVNEPADALQNFLRSRGHAVAIQRVVLLTHPRSTWGHIDAPTVHLASSTSELLARLIRPLPASTDRQALCELEQLILRDHRYHAKPRKRRPPASTGGRPARS
jgi:hypothetical protein